MVGGFVASGARRNECFELLVCGLSVARCGSALIQLPKGESRLKQGARGSQFLKGFMWICSTEVESRGDSKRKDQHHHGANLRIVSSFFLFMFLAANMVPNDSPSFALWTLWAIVPNVCVVSVLIPHGLRSF